MNIHLASLCSRNYINTTNCKHVLESFYYFQDWEKPFIKEKNLLLDSGAFTFMNGGGSNDLNEYLDRYIEFIVENDVDRFFELDVDAVKGLDWVEEARRKIESRTGKQTIPVWHKSRGVEYFKRMCHEYDYIAIGGIVTKEIPRNQFHIFSPLLKYAHEHGCKVHGLGLTNFDALKRYRFDSVDSTSWKSGGRFGTLYKFENGDMKMIKKKNCRIAYYKKADQFNFNEWCKFQKYAEIKL